MEKRYEIRQLVEESDKREAGKELLKNLRDADYAEIAAMEGLKRDTQEYRIRSFLAVKNEVKSSISLSDEVWEARKKDGELLVLWGRRKLEGFDGCLIWCLGTDAIKTMFASFARESKEILRGWVKEYGLLYNAVSEENTDAVKWLNFIGTGYTEPFPRGDMAFRPFYITEETMYSTEKKR
ncbi:hypothetical protein TAMA11512_12880 [Selenomonas sp. TAMA-11512]|uniref:hypothetical protein n=1 Tax=Selenomonas sp. TAMA-11512 TaxID=3095337 RepID=UPI00308ED859|nr:hypothetical protein TAMA11512_12880 [Selenomonas sp. TAMA-11512]